MHVKWFTPILNVSDIQQSFAWFEKLGFKKNWDWGEPPDFGAVGSGACEIFLCENGQGGRGEHGAWISLWVDDVDAVHKDCIARGMEVVCPPEDYPWNVREMAVRHPDGHMFRIGHGIGEGADQPLDAGPPVVIERVDVPLRLEKRLAAVLRDLAEYKGLSLAGCFEETFLHTFESLGGGVASPHTQDQLDHIQELKKKHGIDYDTHASYRFVER